MTSVGPSRSAEFLRSPSQSPVPYLIAGLAAMMGLIAFALTILVCSYLKLSGHDQNRGGGQRDVEAGEGTQLELGIAEKVGVLEDKFLVIMAGEDKPTFLATPASSRAASFNSSNSETADSVTKGTLRIQEQGV